MYQLGSYSSPRHIVIILVILVICSSYDSVHASSCIFTSAIETSTGGIQESPESENFLANLLNVNPDAPPDIVVFLGRFHPLVVHLPISFILLALIIEVFSQAKRFEHLKPAAPFVLLLGFLSSIVAVGAGLLLSLGGDYGGDTLFWHQWLGIAVMFTAGFAYIFQKRALASKHVRNKRIYATFLSLSCAFMIVGSHLGGSLTHGSDYLTSYMPEPVRTWVGISPRETGNNQIVLTNVEEAHVFNNLVVPILESKCTSCHNENKKRGDLILTNQNAILLGGESGSVIEAGNSSISELTRRLRLDFDHEDYMPPDGRKPLPEEHIRILEWWIDEGASFDTSIGQMEISEEMRSIFDRMSSQAEEAALAKSIPPADPNAIAVLSKLGVLVQPISQETNFLQAQFLNVVDTFTDEDLNLLLPLSEQIIWLDLGKTGITNQGLETVGKLTNLTKLHLENTDITDDGLSQLSQLNNLEYLNIYGTSVTDAGLKHLESLQKLRSLYLWQTNVTDEGVTGLLEVNPELYINTGWDTSKFSD